MNYWRFSNPRREFKVKLVILFLDSNNFLIPLKEIFIFEKRLSSFCVFVEQSSCSHTRPPHFGHFMAAGVLCGFCEFLQNINRFEQKNSPRLLTDHKVSMGKI